MAYQGGYGDWDEVLLKAEKMYGEELANCLNEKIDEGKVEEVIATMKLLEIME
jgi:hypothetical protein